MDIILISAMDATHITNGMIVGCRMGHARELITMDVYGDNGNIIAEEIPPELLSYMEEVLPEKKKDNTENVLDTMINVEKFLKN